MRPILIIMVLALAMVGAVHRASAAVTEFGRYTALVIGINNYQHLPELETAVNDASAVHDLLRRDYGFESRLLLNPTRYQIVRALDELRAEQTEQDNLLIYYAGHGVLDKATDEGFWLPVDAEEDSQANWVAVSTVTRTLRAISAKHVLVIADSCYSGVLTREAPVALSTGRERLTELRRLAAKRARKALTSGGLKPVYDGGGDGHSVFTRALLDALRDNREVMDGYQLYTKLRRDVILNAEQTPRYSDIRLAGDEGGDFLFVPASASFAGEEAPEPLTTSLSEDMAVELTFWNSVKDSDSAAVLEAYLSQYPDGAFAALARVRQAELESAGGTEVAALTEPSAAAPSASAFDGVWVGRAKLTSDETLCPYPNKIEVEIVGDRLEGTGRRKGKSYKISAEIDAAGTLKGLVSGGMANSSITGSYEDGRIVGVGDQVSCRWSFELTRKE